MSREFSTRVFEIEDYDAVVELWRRSEGVEIALGDERTTIANYLRRNPGLSRVAVSGDRVVGSALCGHDGRRGMIYHLAVAPSHQGCGIGRQLVTDCIEGLRREGIPRALILVLKENHAGREFWRARGFEELEDAVPYGIDL